MDADGYRAKARELRERSRHANETGNRAHLLMMADEDDWLGAQAEDRQRKSERP
jgi:hypothetical protein